MSKSTDCTSDPLKDGGFVPFTEEDFDVVVALCGIKNYRDLFSIYVSENQYDFINSDFCRNNPFRDISYRDRIYVMDYGSTVHCTVSANEIVVEVGEADCFYTCVRNGDSPSGLWCIVHTETQKELVERRKQEDAVSESGGVK